MRLLRPSARVRLAPDQPIPLHPGEHLSHRRLLDLGKTGEIPLRARPAIPECDQHRQVSNAKAERLEPSLAEADETRAPQD